MVAIFVAIVAANVFARPGEIHYVKSKQATLRAEPRQAAPAKLVIAIGRKVIEFDRKGEWVFIGVDKSGGMDGWIPLKRLGSTDPDGLRY